MNVMRKILSLLGMAAGIAILIFGVLLSSIKAPAYVDNFKKSEYTFNGTNTETAVFGADFYTEQHEATKNAANNINSLGNTLEQVGNGINDIGDTANSVGQAVGEIGKFAAKALKYTGLMTAAFGAVIFCYFGLKFGETLGGNKKSGSFVNVQTSNVSNELPEI